MDQDTPRSGTNRRRRRLLGLALGALVLTAASFGLSRAYSADPKAPAKSDKDKKEKEPPVVAVQKAELAPISAYITATANLVAENEVKIVAEAEGVVVQLLAEEGMAVRRGQKLVQIDKADPVLAVQKAELALRNAALNLSRSERMAAERLISAQDLDKARYDRDLAQHGLDDARYRLEKTSVLAPFDGRITLRNVQTGQAVKPGEALFTIADFDPLVARVFLPEREVIDLKLGQEAQLALKAREDVRFRGRISQISPVVDAASGTVKITVAAVAPPASVRPGAFLTVGIVRETRRGAVLVPRSAVVRELSETYLFVAQDGKARKREVQVGLEEEGRLEITGGLQAGEVVITTGQGALKDQAPIKIAQS